MVYLNTYYHGTELWCVIDVVYFLHIMNFNYLIIGDGNGINNEPIDGQDLPLSREIPGIRGRSRVFIDDRGYAFYQHSVIRDIR